MGGPRKLRPAIDWETLIGSPVEHIYRGPGTVVDRVEVDNRPFAMVAFDSEPDRPVMILASELQRYLLDRLPKGPNRAPTGPGPNEVFTSSSRTTAKQIYHDL